MEQTIAAHLLAIGAVNLNPKEPYTWTSGLRAPIYCDNRLIMSYPDIRLEIAQAMVKLIKQHFPDVEVIAGTATAGIPHAAFVAHLMNLPMIYVRSSAKAHGTKSAIEGKLEQNSKVVMIEDLISTGKSVIQAAEFVKAEGAEVLGCVAVFNYLLASGQQAFAKHQLPLYTLSNYRALIDVATEQASLSEYKATLEEWYQNPVAWSEQFK
ncbi:orotate phosphoribosyltransferase [Aerococcaceae bacterium zg-ZUI334]|uniref:orotate phosphoribosyltransferase n=1 Tax=Aerococcaceae bacterium zg-252 TaxID=2796928 RepID=UPI001BA2EC67|nr:orotate phosphoribosyltransferase [Aerococcaceae bacterium zg-ZUI334]MBS4462628.1 orotate phosphoribosyltransferase [Aerococcaceae bacterium zg-B36]